MKDRLRHIAWKLKSWWMTFARAVGWFNTRLFLTIAYVILIGLPAVALKLIRKDLLDRKMGDRTTYWKDKIPTQHTLEEAKRQF